MRGTTAVPAFCLLVLLVTDAGCQSYGNRAQTINNIFQIPIQTLTAISNFAQNTRPIGEVIQRLRNPQAQRPQQQVPQYPTTIQSYPVYNYQRSRAAKVAGLYTASDGSGFRI